MRDDLRTIVDLGPVHMNGRIYDPLLGRFLSADIVVQAPGNLQSYNRYSYVFNNPLSHTDPSGFIAEGDAYNKDLQRFFKELEDKVRQDRYSNQVNASILGPDLHSIITGKVAKESADQAQPVATPHAETADSNSPESTDGSKIKPSTPVTQAPGKATPQKLSMDDYIAEVGRRRGQELSRKEASMIRLLGCAQSARVMTTSTQREYRTALRGKITVDEDVRHASAFQSPPAWPEQLPGARSFVGSGAEEAARGITAAGYRQVLLNVQGAWSGKDPTIGLTAAKEVDPSVLDHRELERPNFHYVSSPSPGTYLWVSSGGADKGFISSQAPAVDPAYSASMWTVVLIPGSE